MSYKLVGLPPILVLPSPPRSGNQADFKWSVLFLNAMAGKIDTLLAFNFLTPQVSSRAVVLRDHSQKHSQDTSPEPPRSVILSIDISAPAGSRAPSPPTKPKADSRTPSDIEIEALQARLVGKPMDGFNEVFFTANECAARTNRLDAAMKGSRRHRAISTTR